MTRKNSTFTNNPSSLVAETNRNNGAAGRTRTCSPHGKSTSMLWELKKSANQYRSQTRPVPKAPLVNHGSAEVQVQKLGFGEVDFEDKDQSRLRLKES